MGATPRAEDVVRQIAAGGREDLVMVLGNGCCDSTAPYLYDGYYPGSDVDEIGRVADVPVFAQRWLARLYPNDGLTIDVDEEGRSDSFSLETSLGVRFALRLDRGTP